MHPKDPCAGSAQRAAQRWRVDLDDALDWLNCLSVVKTWRACWRQLAVRQTGELSGEPTEREEQWGMAGGNKDGGPEWM
jgi:hypothetical protein